MSLLEPNNRLGMLSKRYRRCIKYNTWDIYTTSGLVGFVRLAASFNLDLNDSGLRSSRFRFRLRSPVTSVG